MACKDIC